MLKSRSYNYQTRRILLYCLQNQNASTTLTSKFKTLLYSRKNEMKYKNYVIFFHIYYDITSAQGACKPEVYTYHAKTLLYFISSMNRKKQFVHMSCRCPIPKAFQHNEKYTTRNAIQIGNTHSYKTRQKYYVLYRNYISTLNAIGISQGKT